MAKLVRVNLAAITHVEWSATVRVPDGCDLDELVRQFYDEIDGGEYTDDPDFREKGDCWANEEVQPEEGFDYDYQDGEIILVRIVR